MITGKITRGSIPISLRELYLREILDNFGTEGLKRALNSYIKTIQYYTDKGINKPGDIKLYNKYIEVLSKESSSHTNMSISVELDELDHVDTEGARKVVYVNVYERNPEARKKAILFHGTKCAVCGFDFSKTYGKLGKGFIHIHHIEPISEIKTEYKINYQTDLIPVCPNCHAMLHRGNLTIDELKEIITKQGKR